MEELQLELVAKNADSVRGETEKPEFVKPKLTFVKPKLEPQGSFEQVTAGFFGTFTP